MEEAALVELQLQPRTLTELMEYAKMIAKTEMVPKALRSTNPTLSWRRSSAPSSASKFLQSLRRGRYQRKARHLRRRRALIEVAPVMRVD
jgi:hypothetical protein